MERHIRHDYSEIVEKQLRTINSKRVDDCDVIFGFGLSSNLVSEDVRRSVTESDWYVVDNGRVVVELRNREKVLHETGMLHVIDFDDTLVDTTQWHAEEHRKLNTLFSSNGTVESAKAQEIYELSKILLTDIDEPRYTPIANLVLASHFYRQLQQNRPYSQAWDETVNLHTEIQNRASLEGDDVFLEYQNMVESAVYSCFEDNPISRFIHKEFLTDMLAGTNRNDVRAIVSRGTLLHELGQIEKIHSSLIPSVEMDGKSIDVIIYTNDLKAYDAPEILYSMFPRTERNVTVVYDDNPKETELYKQWACEQGRSNVKIVRVKHAGSKRRGWIDGLADYSTGGGLGEKTRVEVTFPDRRTATVY